MALIAIYIDDNGKCQPIDAEKDIPNTFAAEFKKYKLCKISVADVADKDVEKDINKALEKWAKTDEAQKDDLKKETKKAKEERQDKEGAAKDTESDEKAKEKDKYDANKKAIKDDPTLNPAQKTKKGREEDERHNKADGAIIKKKSDAIDKAKEEEKDRIKKFKDKQEKPPAISIKCTPDPAVCGDAKCKLTSFGEIEVNNKKQITTTTVDITNIAQFSKNHLYFCTCGKK